VARTPDEVRKSGLAHTFVFTKLPIFSLFPLNLEQLKPIPKPITS